jgi:hypothetical protein
MLLVDATALAERLDLKLNGLPICYACLGIVAAELDAGDERAVRRELRRMSPDLWAEGLALPARAALERARRRGDPDAAAAIADVERMGGRSRLVHAIVRRLAAELSEQVHRELDREFPKGRVMPFRSA